MTAIVTATIREDGANTITATIAQTKTDAKWGDDEYTLSWRTGTTVWAESYDDLAVAIARLAVLQACERSDWNAGFTVKPWDFRQHAFRLFDQTSSWPVADDEEDSWFTGWNELAWIEGSAGCWAMSGPGERSVYVEAVDSRENVAQGGEEWFWEGYDTDINGPDAHGAESPVAGERDSTQEQAKADALAWLLQG